MFLCNFLIYKLDHYVVLYLWNNDWTNLYLPYLRMLPHKLQFFYQLVYQKKIFKKHFSIYSYVKVLPLIVAPPYPRGSWFEQPRFHKVTTFLAIWFFRRFLKNNLYIFTCKKSTPIVTTTYPQGAWFEQSFSGRLVFEKKIFERYQQVLNNS